MLEFPKRQVYQVTGYYAVRHTNLRNPKDELKTGTYHAMLKQLRIDKPELQNRMYIYPVILTEDNVDGGYVVTCRDLPEAITQGDTIEEALFLFKQ